MELKTHLTAMQFCKCLDRPNGQLQSRDCSLEESHSGHKWPSPRTLAVLCHWLVLSSQ